LNQAVGKSVPTISHNHGKRLLLYDDTFQISLISTINKVSHNHQILSHQHENLFQKTKKTGNNYFSTTPSNPPVFNIKASLNTKNSPTTINPAYSPENSQFSSHDHQLSPKTKDGKPRKTNKKPTGKIHAEKPLLKKKPK
jgi:hypothetical protein